MKKKNSKKIIQITISIILVTCLLYWTDVEQFRKAFENAKYTYLFYAVILIFFNRILMPIKWNLLLQAIDIRIRWFESIRIYFIASFLGVFLPPTIGADAVRAFHVHKEKYPISDIMSSILVERLIGLIALLFFTLLGCFLFIMKFSDVTVDVSAFFIMLLIFLPVLTGLFFLSLHKRAMSVFERILNRFDRVPFLGRASKLSKKLLDSYLIYGTRKKILFVFFLLTLLEITLPIIRSYLVAVSLGVDIPLVYFFSFVPIILLLIRLPISFDGFGIQEGGFIYFLSFFGVSATLAFSVGIINHFVFLLGLLPGAFFYAVSGFKKRQYEYLSPS